MTDLSDPEKRVFKHLRMIGVRELDEAVEHVSKGEGIPRYEAAKIMYKLWKKGYVDLEGAPHGNIFRYLASVEGVWFHILTGLVLATLLLVFLVDEAPLLYFRYVLGAVYVLYLPGYSLIEALYPRGDELETLERLALSIGLSLAIVPLVGLALNYTPWGIRLTPVTLSLAIVTEGLALYSLYRKYRYSRLRAT